MKAAASRLSGIALAGVFALAMSGAAGAGEVSSKATEAERLLSEGKLKQAIEALDASVEAFWKEAPLSFRKALFVDGVAGLGEFVPRAGSTFAPNTGLKIYAGPVGFGWKDVAGGETITFTDLNRDPQRQGPDPRPLGVAGRAGKDEPQQEPRLPHHRDLRTSRRSGPATTSSS